MYAELLDLKVRLFKLWVREREKIAIISKTGAPKDPLALILSQKLITIAKRQYSDCEFMVMDMEKLDFEDEASEFAYEALPCIIY